MSVTAPLLSAPAVLVTVLEEGEAVVADTVVAAVAIVLVESPSLPSLRRVGPPRSVGLGCCCKVTSGGSAGLGKMGVSVGLEEGGGGSNGTLEAVESDTTVGGASGAIALVVVSVASGVVLFGDEVRRVCNTRTLVSTACCSAEDVTLIALFLLP